MHKVNSQENVQHETLRREIETLNEAVRSQQDKHTLDMMRLREDTESKAKRKVDMLMGQLEEKEKL